MNVLPTSTTGDCVAVAPKIGGPGGRLDRKPGVGRLDSVLPGPGPLNLAHVDFRVGDVPVAVWCGGKWQDVLRREGLVLCEGCGADVTHRVRA